MTTDTITSALMAAGIDADAITEAEYDGTVTITRPDGSRFVVGDDGADDRGLQWWTGTRYGADDEIGSTDSWTALGAMAGEVSDWLT